MATILKRFGQTQDTKTSGAQESEKTTIKQPGVIASVAKAPQRIKAGSAQILKGGQSSAEQTPHEPVPIAQGGVAARLPANSIGQGDVIGRQKSGSNGLVQFNLSDLVEQGREQIQNCQQQVEAMLQEARTQGEAIKQDAKSAGHAEGKKVATDEIDKRIAIEAEAKAQAQVESLRQAVIQMRTQYDSWMQQYAEVMTVTAIAAAEKLTRREIRLPNASLLSVPDASDSEVASPVEPMQENLPEQEHLLVRWAREALHSTRSAGKLTLAVHPDTLAELGGQFDDLLSSHDLPEQSMVIPDETLTVGEIVVRQDGGEIRAGLNAQLERLRDELMGGEVGSSGDNQ